MRFNNTLVKIYFNATFLRFIVVGIFNTTLNYLTYLLCLISFGIYYTVAGAIGFFAGAISGYLLNRYWTFNSDVPITSGAIKYLLIQMICLLAHLMVQITVTWLFTIPHIYSQFFGIVITTLLNFILSSKLVYGRT